MQLLKEVALPPVAQLWIERLGGRHRVAMLGVGVGAVLLILGLAHWATRPSWVQVYSDIPLESVGPITDRLDEAGIQYRLDGAGSGLMVSTDDLARARVTLARDGGLPSAGRPGLELFDQPSWGMTDFTQRINYRRALEGELERTVGQMRGVEAAQVHLAMDESPGFRVADQTIRASVVLRLRSGGRPADDVVRGIQHLVASSVDGVEAERVTVLDDSGRLLSTPYEPGSLSAVATQEMETRREVERYLEFKAEQLVSQITGASNVRVRVSADVNFDRVQRTIEKVDPEQQAISTEQRSEIIPGEEGGAASNNVTATYMNSRTVETFQGAVGGVERLTVAVLVNDRLGGAAANSETPTWPPETLRHIQSLVTHAVGLNPARGDEISVVSVPFEPAPDLEEPVDVLTMVETLQRPALTALGLLLAFIVTMRLLRLLRAPEPQAAPVKQVAAKQVPAETDGEETEEPEKLLPPEGIPNSDLLAKLEDEQVARQAAAVRGRVAARVQEKPDEAVRLIRAWLREN